MTVVNMEQRRAEQWVAVLVILERLRGEPSGGNVWDVAGEEYQQVQQHRAHAASTELLLVFAPRFIVAPLAKAPVDPVCARFTEMRNSCKWRLLCNKWPDQNHFTSNKHQRRMREMVAGDAQIGTCVSTRRCEDSPGSGAAR